MSATDSASPRVSVVIATYNWSSVLKYAIQSVLWQRYTNWELLVVGDGCTDDSEQVTLSFDDARIRWYNLPENSGNQSMPNNKGIELARGDYIAYLGHDDLWHPDHLALLLAALERTGADLSYAIGELIQPHSPVKRMLTGVSASGRYEQNMALPPSTIMHRRDTALEIGGWRAYRTLILPSDLEFVFRMWQHRQQFCATNELTVFKFPAALRPRSYIEKASHEQAEYTHGLQQDAEFRYRELLAVVLDPVHAQRTFEFKLVLPDRLAQGEITAKAQAVRGVEVKAPADAPAQPLFLDPVLLAVLNNQNDITPFSSRYSLYADGKMPSDGLCIGFGWHLLEQDVWGRRFRWVDKNAELVITRPTGLHDTLQIDIEPGPGVGYNSFTLQFIDEQGQRRATLTCGGSGIYTLRLPIEEGDGAMFRLYPVQGGQRIPTDDRILNFRIFDIRWAI